MVYVMLFSSTKPETETFVSENIDFLPSKTKSKTKTELKTKLRQKLIFKR